MHIVQLAYYVPDAKIAAQHWSSVHGAGPFFVSENIPLAQVHYQGELSSLDHTSAYGWCGNLMIELVQQNCDTTSVFSDRPYGLHHCVYFCSSLETETSRLTANGYRLAMHAATSSGIEFAFLEVADTDSTSATAPAPLTGHYFEIYQDHPQLRSFYKTVEQAAQSWDGKEPLRIMG